MNRLTAILVAALALTVGAHAQSYSIGWYKIAGGGGASSNGQYSVTGTAGQHDAGVLSGGDFTLTGGFWSLPVAVQTPGAPLLSIAQTNGVVTVYWPAGATGFVLDQTATLNGTPPPWSQVAFPYQTNATHLFLTLPQPPGQRYYRLRK